MRSKLMLFSHLKKTYFQLHPLIQSEIIWWHLLIDVKIHMLSVIVLNFSKESLRTKKKELDLKDSPFLDIRGMMKCFNVNVEIILKFSSKSCFGYVEKKMLSSKTSDSMFFFKQYNFMEFWKWNKNHLEEEIEMNFLLFTCVSSKIFKYFLLSMPCSMFWSCILLNIWGLKQRDSLSTGHSPTHINTLQQHFAASQP